MFGRFFRKPSDPPKPAGDSPDDWAVGDQAECVNEDGWYADGLVRCAGPKKSERRRVTGVKVEAHLVHRHPVQFLRLSGYGDAWYVATGFRKVRPQADEAVAAQRNWLEGLIGRHIRAPQELEDA